MGGNMLLDVGPMPDGTIPPEQVQRLEELGKWIADHKEAVYETTAGLPPGYTLSGSSLSTDRKTVYLYLYDRSWDDIAVQGIKNKIKNITLLKTGQPLKHQKIGGADWIGHPGTLWINIPEDQLNPLATVVKIELEGELDLYGVSK
jgi:alpha-L-fucosidase